MIFGYATLKVFTFLYALRFRCARAYGVRKRGSFALYPALMRQRVRQKSHPRCFDVAGLLSVVPCRGLDPWYSNSTVLRESVEC